MKNEFDWHIQINKMQNLNDSHSKIRSNFYEKSWKLLFCLCEKNPSQQTEIF